MSTSSEIIEDVRRKLGSKLAIVAHHYQTDDIVRHADHTGDSLELSRLVATLPSKDIVFCGVSFMAESAAILVREDQRVHLPEWDSDCVMSEMAPAELVEKALAALTAQGRKVVPLAYVNTSAEVKAIVGKAGGATCTSANADKMLTWALGQGDSVLFLPDRMLAENTANKLGIGPSERTVIAVRFDDPIANEDTAKARLVMWPGRCVIHHRFKPEDVREFKRTHPGAKVLVHPECPPETVAESDGNGSTSYLIREAEAAPEGAVIGMGTETNLVNRLARRYAGKKTILPLKQSFCTKMSAITEAKLARTVSNLDADIPVTVTPEARDAARLALSRMLEASR